MSSLPLAVLRESPRSASILVQLDCNARCPFCSTRVYTEQGVLAPVDYRQGVVRSAKEYTLSLEALVAHYDALRAEGVERVSLQGGEPTLHPGLPALVRHGRALGFASQSVVSNGRALKDPALLSSLVEAGVDTIVLSIFGGTAGLHDASMGVSGAFDDLARAVENLVALRRRGGRVTVMAQMTLHAGNFAALPETVRHWYGAGLRDFSFRLLRETENTRRHAADRWFFDLESLRAPLAEALDFCRGAGDAIVTMGELFYCLAPAEHLGFVLRDVGANPALRGAKRQVSKHFEASLPDARARAGSGEACEACEACDLEAVCVRPESAYRAVFTGGFATVSVAGRVRELVAGWTPALREEALHLLGAEQRLAWFGVPDDDRLALRGLAAAALEGDPRQAEVVLGDRGRKELLDRLRKGGRRPVSVRLVPLREFGAEGPLDGEAQALLTRLDARCPPERRAALEFIRKAGVLANEPLVLLVAYVRKAPEGEQLVVTAIHDDRHLGAALLSRVLDGLVRSVSAG